MENSKTKAWEYYEQGRDYNRSLTPDLYRTVNTNIEFFAGNQWLHIPETSAMSRLPRPVFNIIKRITSLFVASLTSSATTISFEPLSYYGAGSEDAEAAEYAGAEVRSLFEKLKLDYRIREALFDGAQTGDYCAHFYWDPEALPYGGMGGAQGEIKMELIDGVNVMFGNPNTTDVESQPYILIVGRDTVDNLRREAEHYRALGGGGVEADIRPDSERAYQAAVGGRTELNSADGSNGKALYVYLYTKVRSERPFTDKNGVTYMRPVTTVHVTKATKDCNIFEDVDTGLSRYPIAWGNWERQKNQYHGRALVTGIVPNQIFINSMMALVFRHLQLQSFPKTVYNADLIGRWNNEVGTALGVRGLQPGQDLRSVASVLQPADMSSQIVMAIDKVMEYTKECLGATDAQMGSLDLDNTSALMVLQSSSEVPLENPRAILHEWVEDIGAILLDMMGTYYGRRPIVRMRDFEEPLTGADGMPVIDGATGLMKMRSVRRRVVEEYDFSRLKNLWLKVSVEVGAATRFSEIAMVQSLDNLRRDGTLSLVDYLERVPDRLIPRKQELIDDLRRRSGEETAEDVTAAEEPARDEPGHASQPEGSNIFFGAADEDKAIASLPGKMQAAYGTLPDTAKRTLRVQGAKI